MRQNVLMTVSVRSLRPVVARLRVLGIDPEPVLAAAGIERASLDDAEARIPHVAALMLWHEATSRSGDEAFGIHVAEDIRPGAFDVLDYAIRASATLGEGLARLVRYHRILHDAAVVELRVEDDHAWLAHVLPDDAAVLPRPVAEFIVAAWLVVARQATALELAPIDVRFRHAAPADTSEHRRVFRAPVLFSQSANGMRLPRAALDTSLVKSDVGLCAVLEQYVQELLGRIPVATSVGQRVRQLVAARLSTGIDSETIAKKMHMSRRTLHRRLASEGISFKQLLDDLRRDLAMRYLAEPRMAIAEVAFLLGFSEASAFHRAFKRWYGHTAAEHRRSTRDEE